MPDHVHLFVRITGELRLGTWIGGLKRLVAKEASLPSKVWQRGFFDHVLRSNESYALKWEYVRQNPVRAGLVPEAVKWPFAGEIVTIDRV